MLAAWLALALLAEEPVEPTPDPAAAALLSAARSSTAGLVRWSSEPLALAPVELPAAIAPIGLDRSLIFRPDLALRLSAGSEWDTNARRLTTSQGQDRGPSDGVVRIVGDLRARLAITPRDGVSARYVVGAKRFFREEREDLFVHDLTLDGVLALDDTLELEARARYRASTIRNRNRDYTLYTAGGGLEWRPIDGWSFRGEARVDALEFGPTCLLSYVGPAIQGSVGWQPFEKIEIGAAGGFSWRTYEGRYDPNVGLDVRLCNSGASRHDGEPFASIYGAYKGAIIVGGDVVAHVSRSDVEAENSDRYRISAYASVPLALDVVLSVSGRLQFNRGRSVTQILNAVEDDENQTGVEAQLSRPLADPLEIVARYALYANAFATAPDTFVRHTFYLGLSAEIGGE